MIGLPLTGVITDQLRKTRIRAEDVFVVGVSLFVGLQVLLALQVTWGLTIIWGLFGLLSSVVYLTYAILTPHFPKTLTGRAITATNFFMFVVAFAGPVGNWLDH